jgi:ubiquinone/menaquinone biosynthesis C-methylase UbiE
LQLNQPNIARTCREAELYESLLALNGAEILELGCGKAENARDIAAAHRAAKVIAAEVDSIQHAENLASARPSNLAFADFGAEAIPLADASMDVVMMFKSLHHVPVELLDRALSEIRRVLKPAGYAYISEPVFAGELNDIVRIFNDEESVRLAAFDAVCRAVQQGLFELSSETFFLAPARFKDFEEFERRYFRVTHSERKVSPAQRSAVERLFNAHLGPSGVRLAQPIRVDLLRKR